MKVQIASEVKFKSDEYLEPREYRKIDRTMLLTYSGSQAYKDANLKVQILIGIVLDFCYKRNWWNLLLKTSYQSI